MDVQKELERWMLEFRQADTPEKVDDHKKRFKEFIKSLSEEDGHTFAKAFAEASHEAVSRAREVAFEINIKKRMEKIQDIVSYSYIAKKYFGKSRHWLYQRINANIVNGKPAKFTDEELKKLVYALDDICGLIQDTSRSIA